MLKKKRTFEEEERMEGDEDGKSPNSSQVTTSDLGPSENMRGILQLEGFEISDLQSSGDGAFYNMMQTNSSISFLENHASDQLLSDESFEPFSETTAHPSENTMEGDILDHAVEDMVEFDHSNLSMAEHQNHHLTHHSHGNLSMGMMMEHDHDEYDHAHGGRQLMMEIGILTSLVMLILALVILLVIPSNRCRSDFLNFSSIPK